MLGVPPPQLMTYGNGRYSLRTRIPKGLFFLSFNTDLIKYKKNKFETWDVVINDSEFIYENEISKNESSDKNNDIDINIRNKVNKNDLNANRKRNLIKPYKNELNSKYNYLDNAIEDLLEDMDTELSCNNEDLLKDVTIDELEENYSEVLPKNNAKVKKINKAEFKINPMCKTPVFKNDNKDLTLEIISTDGFNKIYIENNTYINSKIGTKFTIKSQDEYIIVNYSSSIMIYTIYTKK